MELGFDWDQIACNVNSDLKIEEQPDQRKLPIAYPQLGGERDLATECGCDGVHAQCKWGVKSSHSERCMYHRFRLMCDKVITSDGKEVN